MLHLIHPACIHFTVAFIVTGAACEVWGLLAERGGVQRFGSTLLLVGLMCLVPAIASGYLAANTLEFSESGARLLDSHERNGWILLAVLLASQFWKAWFRGEVPRAQRWPYAAVLIATLLLTVYSAFLGGSMVYGEGVGVDTTG